MHIPMDAGHFAEIQHENARGVEDFKKFLSDDLTSDQAREELSGIIDLEQDADFKLLLAGVLKSKS